MEPSATTRHEGREPTSFEAAREPRRLAAAHPLDHVLGVRRDLLGFMLRCAEEGPIVRLDLPGIDAVMTSHPEAFRRILVDDVRHYDKQTRGFAELRNVLGDGLLTSEGELWKRQRRLMQPSFHRDTLARFDGAIVRATERMAERWMRHARTGTSVDVLHELMAITLELVGGTLLGADVTGETELVGVAMDAILAGVQTRLGWPYRPSIDAPLPTNVRMRAARARVREVAMRLIEGARTAAGRDDLLAVLVRARDPETGEAMSDEQLRDEALTLLAAGHETTANALTWTLYLLAEHPDEDARLADELARVLGGRPPTAADMPALVYTQQVFKESMRLYPPAFTLARLAQRDDVLLGRRIHKGSHVFGSIYAMHRRPEYYPDPHAFRPERFAPESERARPRLAYLPFGAGPHLCIGQPFAMLEGVLVLATLLQRVRVATIPGTQVVPDPKVTLRPKGGLRLLVSRR